MPEFTEFTEMLKARKRTARRILWWTAIIVMQCISVVLFYSIFLVRNPPNQVLILALHAFLIGGSAFLLRNYVREFKESTRYRKRLERYAETPINDDYYKLVTFTLEDGDSLRIQERPLFGDEVNLEQEDR